MAFEIIATYCSIIGFIDLVGALIYLIINLNHFKNDYLAYTEEYYNFICRFAIIFSKVAIFWGIAIGIWSGLYGRLY